MSHKRIHSEGVGNNQFGYRLWRLEYVARITKQGAVAR
jgi:hypothetical protein